jgi:putative ABC transport system permease protein
MNEAQFKWSKRIDFAWLAKMAWRDSRRNRPRLLLFISSIVLGISALTATFSLGANVQTDIDTQAKTLVGADLAIESNRPPDSATIALIDSLGPIRSEDRAFASMVYFVKSGGTRLVQVHAIAGDFPYYGKLETTPGGADGSFRRGREALVDKTLMLQYNAQVGDSIKIGEVSFAIAGNLNKAPGRTGISTTIAPPVYIPLQYLRQAGLQKRGSRISFNYYYKYDRNVDVEKMVSTLVKRFDKAGLEYETIDSRKRNTGRAFGDFSEFLTLISFVALLLGSIGVASSVHIYMREKISSIAILRCLGTNGTQAFLIYLIQVAGIGLLGSLLGAGLGVIVQQLFPLVLKDFLPIELSTAISWSSLAKGVALGMVISVLFALLPLVSVRNISPLYTLRLFVEQNPKLIDPVKGLIYILIFGFIIWFTDRQIHSWTKATIFTMSVLGAFLVLVCIAWALRWTVRRFFPASWNYLWRQAFANLYRPNNQTVILITTIGLGTAFIGILYFVHTILIDRVALSGSKNQPNMVLFDIQSNQKDSVADLVKSFHLPLLDQIPVVTMRITEINGQPPESIRQNDSSEGMRRRAFEGEIRATYRDSLTGSEQLVIGKLGPPIKSADQVIHISVEEQYASHVHLKVGDHITFNVQGVLVQTVIGSLRKVDWRRMQTNFRFVFPSGVLESAPQFHVLITRISSPEASAHFQQAVVRQFPTISIIDLGLILSVLDEVLDKIGLVIRFMAAFSILTGLVVLIASVLISKYQRMQESVLLRTLGASRRQILSITALEYLFLGALAAATGILLSLPATWALAKFSFDASFSPNWMVVLLLFLCVCVLTVVIGLVNSREVLNKPPLEVLRKEV